MSIAFCHISPTPHLHDFALGRRWHLLLAHLIEEDEQYREFYTNLKTWQPGVKYIMDNSAFEMYKQGRPMYPTDKLLTMARAVNADYIVMSDYPGQPWTKTRDVAVELGKEYKNQGFKSFYCPQSEIGDLDGLIESFKWAADAENVDYVGFSILNIPNGYGVEKDNKLQRFLSRAHFVSTLRQRGILQEIIRNFKKIHFLGMLDGPNEINFVPGGRTIINTWDSSAAVWAGLHGIQFDRTPTGLISGKFEKEVDFSFKCTDDRKIQLANGNVSYIDNLCNI